MKQQQAIPRRGFLKRAAKASAAFAVPTIVPAAVLGRTAAVPPSERIVMAGLGIGRRGTYDLMHFLQNPKAHFRAVCDVKAKARADAKKLIDDANGNQDCDVYRDFRDLLDRDDIDAVLIATGPNWHAMVSAYAARAGKDIYCEKPCTKNVAQSLELAEIIRRTGRVFQAGTQRRNLPHFAYACHLAQSGKLGKLHTMYAHPAGMKAVSSGWAKAEPEPPREKIDWDLYLGPAAWRPFNKQHLDGFNFEKGGGMVGGGVLEWGSHCVDLCQWANNADDTAAVKYSPPVDRRITAEYANGVKLVIKEDGWLPLGSCPVRFEGDDGWVEAGDSGRMVFSSPELRGVEKIAVIGGYPITFHVEDFLRAVKTRGTTRCNADVACHSHITCHGANIALYLDREVTYDPVQHQFVNDDEANRLLSEGQREPWCM